MLYVYSFYEDFEEGKNEEEVLKEISSCKDLRPFGDGYYWISKTDTIILNGKERKANDKFCSYVIDDGLYDESEYLKITSHLSDGELEITKARALELLSDDLRQADSIGSQYEERIWNAEDPSEETDKIINELILCVYEMVIDELKDELEKIRKNGVEWE